MILPDDYGLSAEQTFAHVGDPVPAGPHSPFWSQWNHAVYAHQPQLRARVGSARDASDLTADMEFESVRSVRVGCRLAEPTGPVRGAVVVLHGYGNPGPLDEDVAEWSELVSRGVAVLGVRVRGYPGSRQDVGPISDSPEGYAVDGLESCDGRLERAMDWIMPQAAADVVNAYRALRRWLGPDIPISIAGESFGGALAIIAAAQLSLRDDPDRLVLGVPTMGDWPWRFGHTSARGSVGGDVQEALVRVGLDSPRAGPIREALRVLDAVIHAAKVRCPTLCKLAKRDEVVPAPAAAAVYNALGTDPGLKWRFIVPFGHFDGGLSANRREVLFGRCALDFLTPGQEPSEAMRPWEPVLSGGDAGGDKGGAGAKIDGTR
jgi:cephalosporin-C deacetylase-like acetyl esterase